MKVIVFGGSGFLGSHVAEALTRQGHSVTVFDRRPSPYLAKGQRMVIGEITDEPMVNKVIHGQEIVYNFAGYADLESAATRPLETVKSNILGNCVLLENCRKHRVKRYVFASTVYVYSATGSFYRDSKQACENYIESYHRMWKVPYTILRFGSLYGPRAPLNNSIARLLGQAYRKGKIEYWGDGEEVREYIHVKDAADSSIAILDDKYRNRCFVITGANPMKVRDLLTLIQEMLNHRVKVIFKRAHEGPYSVHYKVTPYSFLPKEGIKLIRTESVDFGQGLLALIQQLHNETARE